MANAPPQPDYLSYLDALWAVLREIIREGREWLRLQGRDTLGAIPWTVVALWGFAFLGFLSFLRWLFSSLLRLGVLAALVAGAVYLLGVR